MWTSRSRPGPRRAGPRWSHVHWNGSADGRPPSATPASTPPRHRRVTSTALAPGPAPGRWTSTDASDHLARLDEDPARARARPASRSAPTSRSSPSRPSPALSEGSPPRWRSTRPTGWNTSRSYPATTSPQCPGRDRSTDRLPERSTGARADPRHSRRVQPRHLTSHQISVSRSPFAEEISAFCT